MKITEDIVKQFRDLLDRPLWLDENFKKKIGELSEEEAFEKPLPELHSVGELISHLTVWVNACIDRMTGIQNDLKDNDSNDWKNNGFLKTKGWKVLKEEFYSAHNRLISFVESCDEDLLAKKYHVSEFTTKDILFGLIQHDAYHLGQIGITIKFLKAGK